VEAVLSKSKNILSDLDPRVKWIVFILYSVPIALSIEWNQLLCFSPLPAASSIIWMKEWKNVLPVLLPANGFLAFVSATVAFSDPDLALFLILKSNLLILLTLSLLASSSIFEILHALHHLGLPNKLLQLLFFSYRYIHTLKEQLDITLKSAKARGFSPATNMKTYKTYAYLLTNLLVRSYIRSENIFKAMKARGYRGEVPVFRHFKMKTEDRLFLGFAIMLWIGGIWLFWL